MTGLPDDEFRPGEHEELVGRVVRTSAHKYAVWKVHAVLLDGLLELRSRTKYGKYDVSIANVRDVSEVCGVDVSDGHRSLSWHWCGKSVKDRHLCGVHLAAEARAEAKNAAEVARKLEAVAAERSVMPTVERLRAAGIPASVAVGADYRAVQKVKLGYMTLEQAQALLERLEAL